MKRSSTLLIGGGAMLLIILLLILSSIFATAQKTTTTKPEEKKITTTTIAPAGRGGCPATPYTYCSSDTIQKVYISSGCTPSAEIIRKLVQEGKISGESDPKVVNCSKNPELCTAAGIRSYPSVICESTPTNIYEGYCP